MNAPPPATRAQAAAAGSTGALLRIVVVGNHTCANRGDSAILRGLLDALGRIVRDADVVVTSRFPVSSSYLLGRDMAPDLMEDWAKDLPPAFFRRLSSAYRRKGVPLLMGLASPKRRRWIARLLPSPVRQRVAALRAFDLVIQVGGSFFVDLYGARQFEVPFAAMLAGRPLLLIGHSLGPFEDRLSRLLARLLLEGACLTTVREPVSRRLLEQGAFPLGRVRNGADTAWLVRPPPPDGRAAARIAAMCGGRPAVAITLRELSPFDRRLGVTQARYEAAFARLADRLIAGGYDVVAVSTCTGIERYRDDRIPALRVRKLVGAVERFHVVMDELNDVELGALFGACALLVGTRLHSAIIAMNFGTPAIAVNYEHKSEGTMAQLGLADLSASLAMLIDGTVAAKAAALLEDLPGLRDRVAGAVERERARALAMVEDCLAAALPAVPDHAGAAKPPG